MKCSKCGTDNDINNTFCSNCGNELRKENISIQTETNNTIIANNSIKNNNDKNMARILGIISLVLFFLSSTILNVIGRNLPEQAKSSISSLSGICPMAGIIIMIFGRIKYPNSKFLKGVMWSIIVSIALVIIFIILLIGACYAIIGYEG